MSSGGKKQEKKEDFLVSFWSSPMLDFTLLQVEHLHLCVQPITYLIAVFFPCFSLFFQSERVSTGGISSQSVF